MLRVSICQVWGNKESSFHLWAFRLISGLSPYRGRGNLDERGRTENTLCHNKSKVISPGNVQRSANTHAGGLDPKRIHPLKKDTKSNQLTLGENESINTCYSFWKMSRGGLLASVRQIRTQRVSGLYSCKIGFYDVILSFYANRVQVKFSEHDSAAVSS